MRAVAVLASLAIVALAAPVALALDESAKETAKETATASQPPAGSPQQAPSQPPAGEPPKPAEPAARPTPPDYRSMVKNEAARAGLPPEVADAVAQVESGYDPSAVGVYGEIGLMQVLPSTARLLGFTGTLPELADPQTNIRYGVSYLAEAWRLANKDICTTVMKYRAGHGETRFSYRSVDYCVRVRAILAAHGFPVTGEVPKPTFGEPVARGAVPMPPVRMAGLRRKKSRYNWAAADARMKAITSKITMSTLRIMQ